MIVSEYVFFLLGIRRMKSFLVGMLHIPKMHRLHLGLGKNLLVRIYRRAVLFAASLVKR